MNRSVAIAGVGITPFGKFQASTVRSMTEAAVHDALRDAGLSGAQVDEVYFANAVAGIITGQEMIRGEVALRHSALAGKPVINVENACASSATAFHLGVRAVAAGQADIVVVVGAEKMTHEDKKISMAAFGKGVDLEEPVPAHVGGGSGSVFMDIYAEKTRKFMAASHATPEDFAQVVVKSRRAGSLNPSAQFREPTSIEAVLAARAISGVLTLPMCSSISDGAAAIVLLSAAAAQKHGIKKPVWVAATALVAGHGHSDQPLAAVRVAREIYEKAGVSPSDIHVAELHDATAPAELIHYENLSLCEPGGSAALLRSGATDIGGRISVNPSGGLLSRGHPLGATGAAQIIELTHQLRATAGARQRPNASVALAENNGGQMGPDAAVASATILHR